MDKIRIAMLGCGMVAQCYAPVFPYLKEGELAAVIDIDEAAARTMADKYDVGKVYTDVGQAAADPHLDAFIIGTPPNLHAEHVEVLAGRGKHILCEKPMASTVEDCLRIIAACKRNDVKLQMAHMKRFMRGNQKVKAIVDSGMLGKVFMAECHWDCAVPQLIGTYREQKATGGGSLQDHGPHAFDLIRWWAGNDIVEVSASIGIVHPQRPTEDFAVAVLEHENGMVSYHHMTRVSYGREHSQDTYRLYGTQGTLVVKNDHHFPTTSLEPPEILLYRPDGIMQRLDPGRVWSLTDTIIENSAFYNQTKAFCDCIIHDTEPRVTGADGLHAIEAVVAAYVSAWKREKVRLPFRERVDLNQLFSDIAQRSRAAFGDDYTIADPWGSGPELPVPRPDRPPRTKEKCGDDADQLV
jgi:predicted dehydrogenase